ncbi:homoserine O- acetyltransferase [Dinochytrium kinnereticum]|nr:homoserine O- acetyltransferase [Dinochytrium kinnereticum]
MSALLTYRSRNSFETRFGRNTVPTKPLSDTASPQQQALLHNEGNKLRLHYGKGERSPTSSTSTLDKAPNVFSAQSYLRYQGDKFIKRFDANCYIALTRKMDCHDISLERGTYEEALASIEQPTLVIGIETDGLFTLSEQYELSEQIPNAEIIIIHSFEGHDGFLLEFEQMNKHLTAFIQSKTPHLIGDIRSDLPMEAKKSTFGESEGPDALMW